MDPNASLTLLVNALRARDYETARDHAADLHEWLAKGGIMPLVSRDALLALTDTRESEDD